MPEEEGSSGPEQPNPNSAEEEPAEEAGATEGNAGDPEETPEDGEGALEEETAEPEPAAEEEAAETEEPLTDEEQQQPEPDDTPERPEEEESSGGTGEPEEPAPEEAEEEAEQEAEEEAEDEETEEEISPPHLGRVNIPVVGSVPLWVLGMSIGVAFLAFVVTLVLGLRGLGEPEAPSGAERRAAAGVAPDAPIPAEEVAALDYQRLLERAEQRERAGDYAAAAQLYRSAAAREGEGVPRVLYARHKLSRTLLRLGRYREAFQMAESLRSLGRPGSELWKHALSTSITVLGDQERWEEYFRQLYLLRANSARYGDEAALNRWLTYKKSMARMRQYLDIDEAARRLYGMEPPAFGEESCKCRPLSEADARAVTGGYGDRTVEVDYAPGELYIRSDGAPLSQVLTELERATRVEIEHEAPADYGVTACLNAVGPEEALEVVLGTVGLRVRADGEVMEVLKADPVPATGSAAAEAALWAVQEFLILYPESGNVPEAYYVLAHLYMARNKTRLALDQLSILCSQYPQSSWAAWAHYLAGRAWYDLDEWERAEQELLRLADGWPDHRLAPVAFLWAGQSEFRLEKYEEAATCFRQALAGEVNKPLEPQILYNIAICLEKTGAAPEELEERYLELRSRFPRTDYASRADYRLARMALERGFHRKAVDRYETYLERWPADSEKAPQACCDLLKAYVECGETFRAVMLGEVLVHRFGYEKHFWDALPDMLRAYRECDLHNLALAALGDALAEVQEPERRRRLRVEQARLLLDRGSYKEAEEVLERLKGKIEGESLRSRAELCRARLLMATRPAKGLELARRLAVRSTSKAIRCRALRMIAEHYRETGKFDEAALAYSGKCQAPGEGSGR